MVVSPPDGGFFERVNFIGGVGPGHDWLKGGWIYISKN